MNTLNTLCEVTGFKPAEMDKIYQEVKANSAKLNSCAHHDFSIPIDRHTKQPIPERAMFCRWRCSRCQGDVDGICKSWYELGIKHASQTSDATRNYSSFAPEELINWAVEAWNMRVGVMPLTNEPFQREKDIRAGKLDAECPGYEEITGWLGRVPMTWLPGLLVRAVQQCVVRKVFKDKDALLRVADQATKPYGFLRAP